MFAPAEFLSLEHTAHPKLFEIAEICLGRAETDRELFAVSPETGGAGRAGREAVHQQHGFHRRGHDRRTRRGLERAGLDRRELSHPERLLRAGKRDRRRRRGDGELVRIQELHHVR